jgi:sulfur carrier protein ThiS adenylyltransferase
MATLTESNPVNSEERYQRQSAILPMEKLRDCPVTIIGVGAIGRQVALQLAVIGVTSLTLIDHDVVEAVNLGAQGYLDDDLGRPKVEATADMVNQLNRDVAVYSVQRRFLKSEDAAERVFCCVDSIETRRHIFSALKDRLQFFVDGRMSAETLRVLTVCDGPSLAYYPRTLFAADEAFRAACTARTTYYAANIAAGMMVSCFARWIRGIRPPMDLSLNLLADELVVGEATGDSG